MRITLALPAGYRAHDTLAFHARDPEGTAETVHGQRIRKGIMQDGVALRIEINLEIDLATDQNSVHGQAHCVLDADGVLTSRGVAGAREAISSMLGLRIDPAPFLDAVGTDPLLGPLAHAQPGLRVIQSASIFEALSWAIIGQQINLSFAIALRRTLIEQAGHRHSSGLWCYPAPADVARLGIDQLTTRKFSRAKAETLQRLAALVDSGAVTLERGADVEATSAQLLAIKGIGPWTVNYALLRGYGYPDCSLHGDVAIRSALQRLLGEEVKPDMARTEALLRQYAPHRTMAAAHLWSSLSSTLRSD